MTTGKPLERSNLIDITCTQIYSTLSGHTDGTTPQLLEEYVESRIDQLKAISAPFGRPSDASREKINSGSVTLNDGITVAVEESDKEFIFAISRAFSIDEIHSLILFRSFLYNQGLQSDAGSDPGTSLVQDLVDAITPFYCAERLAAVRILIPLLRARETISDPFHSLSHTILPKIIPDSGGLVNTIIEEYRRKTKEDVLEKDVLNYKVSAHWAKQNMKEQLVMLEVLFWVMWGLAPCDGPTVQSIFKAAYETNLGSQQQNSSLLLGEEAQQLQQDIAVLWMLICVEVLEVETVAEPGFLEVSDSPSRTNLYTADPGVLTYLHDLITRNQGNQFACIYLAWTFIVSRFASVAETLSQLPQSYRPFLELILPSLQPYATEREPTYVLMSKTCLDPETGLLSLLLNLLTNSPWFATSVAWRTGSHITDPNALAFRSLLKGLLIALVELVPVEHIADFDCLVEIWVALFGRSESQTVTALCKQFWRTDWHQGIARRAIFEVARARFPVQARPLIQLLRSMTSSGFLDTDPLYIGDTSREISTEDREFCLRHVFYFFDRLSSYAQVIPLSECTGVNARYERQQERYTSSTSLAGVSYTTLRETRLPGGAMLHPGTPGRLLSGDLGDSIVVCWDAEYSGWKLCLEILESYLTQQQLSIRPLQPNGKHSVSLALSDIGLAADGGIDDGLVTHIFDLMRSVILDSPVQAEELMQTLERGVPSEKQPPDLVQLTTTILEEALSRTSRQHTRPIQLITSALSILSAILAIPQFSNRVWIYIRSTAVLFGSEKTSSSVSTALAAERSTGHYTITLGLLKLIQQLCEEASSVAEMNDTQLQKLKYEVLLRAMRFVHIEIWVEHLGWKYAQLGDRFEIGKRVADFYIHILQMTPRDLDISQFKVMSQSIMDLLLLNSTNSTLAPIVSSITAGQSLLQTLHSSRRFGDYRKLVFLLESHLQLTTLLMRKRTYLVPSRLSLLEHMLCARPVHSNTRAGAIDVLTSYVQGRTAGPRLPLLAVDVLSALCSSLSSAQPSSTLAAYFSDPESAIASFVRIVQHPYEELSLRHAIWKFFVLAMDHEPAFATLLVAGHFQMSTHRKDKDKGDGYITAMRVARDSLSNCQILWDSNPQLLAAILRFVDAVWRHESEHTAVLEHLQHEAEFWQHITSLVSAELGPLPDYEAQEIVFLEGAKHSPFHDIVAMHCYRTLAKSYALHIAGIEIGRLSAIDKATAAKQHVFQMIVVKFKSEEDLTDLLSEAAPNSYRPEIYDQLEGTISQHFPGLSVQMLQVHERLEDRDFGDDFAFSSILLHHQGQRNPAADVAENLLLTLNLNLSLMHSQLALTESWQFLLQRLVPHLRGNKTVRPILLTVASSLSYDISKENRRGDMAATIHKTRLSFLVAILELAWFSSSDAVSEIKAFIEMVDHVRIIILNEHQSAASSLLGLTTTPFHTPLLQLLYFCTRFARSLGPRPNALQAEHRLKISLMVEDSLSLVINALGAIFPSARSRMDPKLDFDMELLVGVFQQCTRPDVNPSSSSWLSRCQEADVIQASLDLYAHIDLVGLSDIPHLIHRGQPLYVPHLILFHTSLASIPAAAERLACEGILAAYSSNFISDAINLGKIDVAVPELPAMRSPAHFVYCSILAVLSGVIMSMGPKNHYFHIEVCGVIQHLNEQIVRALSWSSGDVITLPFLEEIERVVQLFYTLSTNAPLPPNGVPAINHVLTAFAPRALHLLQQLNYALTHPNHLSSTFEPVTPMERSLLEVNETAKEPSKRPSNAYLAHRLYRISCALISTLINISRADSVLIHDKDAWILDEARVIPHTKVVLGEPASLGTLLELGNTTIDVLRDIVDLPSDQSLFTPSPVLHPLTVREGVTTVRRNLEVVLVYAVTQLAMWLVKPEAEPRLNEMDTDNSEEPSSERRLSSLQERLRRGMTGELATDIQSLIQRAKPIVAKTVKHLPSATPDLSEILSLCLREKILNMID